MEVSAGHDGITRLLQAEREAQAIVTAARKAKTDRLKQAKTEAEREIKAYKAQREEQYQTRVAEDSNSSGANVKRLENESKIAVQAVEKNVAAKKKEVLDTLLSYVMTVKFQKA